jgi:hypothetical protein
MPCGQGLEGRWVSAMALKQPCSSGRVYTVQHALLLDNLHNVAKRATIREETYRQNDDKGNEPIPPG